jgi:DNA-binding NarL/FixJ family response regulator
VPSVVYMRGRIQILVADRNVLVVEALLDLFVELNGGTPVLTAGTLQETLTIAQHEQPELIVIDAWIGADADQTIRDVVERSPRSAVFVMATNCDSQFERRMIRAGATGCCEKEAVPARARSILDDAKARQ